MLTAFLPCNGTEGFSRGSGGEIALSHFCVFAGNGDSVTGIESHVNDTKTEQSLALVRKGR